MVIIRYFVIGTSIVGWYVTPLKIWPQWGLELSLAVAWNSAFSPSLLTHAIIFLSFHRITRMHRRTSIKISQAVRLAKMMFLTFKAINTPVSQRYFQQLIAFVYLQILEDSKCFLLQIYCKMSYRCMTLWVSVSVMIFFKAWLIISVWKMSQNWKKRR